MKNKVKHDDFIEVITTQDNFDSSADWIAYLESQNIPLNAAKIVRKFRVLKTSEVDAFRERNPEAVITTGTIVGKE